MGLGKGADKKSDKKSSAQDPKSAALAHLGIAIGSKNMRNLRKEDIDEAFIRKMHDSEYKWVIFDDIFWGAWFSLIFQPGGLRPSSTRSF